MEKGQAAEKIKAFLDASVLVAAALSPKGGSFRILTEAAVRNVQLRASRYAYGEAERNIKEKYPHRLEEFYHLTQFFVFTIEPSKKLVEETMEVIDFKDTAVLAAALNIHADVLLTLDRKHFLENPLIRKRYPLMEILAPGDFIQKYFK